jgi:protein TonB
VGTQQPLKEKTLSMNISSFLPEVLPSKKEIEKPKEEFIPKPEKLKPILRKKTVKKVVKKKTQVKQKASAKSKVNPAKKNAFLSKVSENINKNKTFPRIAQRRGMKGSIKVRFVILPNGDVGNIRLKGPSVFHNAAREAVKKSFPISIKNAPVSLPLSVNFTLHFK